jgi:hypothetical protein
MIHLMISMFEIVSLGQMIFLHSLRDGTGLSSLMELIR